MNARLIPWPVAAIAFLICAGQATAPAPALSGAINAATQTYTLNPSQSGKAFRDKLAALGKIGQAAPPTPTVDLTLQLKNNTDKPMTLTVGGDQSSIELKLDGPGAVTIPNNVAMTMEFRSGQPVTIPPGKTYDMPIKSLSFGMRGISQCAYWTEPGEYTLSATFTSTADDGSQTKITSEPIKLKVAAPADAGK